MHAAPPQVNSSNVLCRGKISATGVGLFSGEEVSISLCPGETDAGIVFQRVDLPHRPLLPARSEYVQGTPRCTIIGNGKEYVQTIEHLWLQSAPIGSIMF